MTFPVDDLISLLSERTLFKRDYIHLKDKKKLSESILYCSAPQLFHGIQNPEVDLKLLCSGSVYRPVGESCVNGQLGYYTMALLLLRKRTIVFNHIEKRIAEFYILYELLKNNFGLLSHFNIYWSPSESIGAGPHTDDHDVIIVQLAGKKKWKFEYGEINLSAGEILCIRKGTLHDPVTEDKHQSIHLTMGIVEGSTSFPEFKTPSRYERRPDYEANLKFINSMGNLLSVSDFTVHFDEGVIIEYSPSYIRFSHRENEFTLSKQVFYHIFDRQSLTTFRVRSGITSTDAINIILSFYKMKIPCEIKGTN